MAATFSSAPASVAYDKTASQATGALCTGMGYDPKVATTATVASKYIGGAAQTIGYGKGVAEPAPKAEAKK